MLQLPAATAGRGAAAATVSRNATNTASAVARTNRPPLVASLASRGTVDSTRPPSAGSVAMAWQGIETSSASGAPDTSGAVMSVTMPSGPGAWGQAMVAVVCLTGSSGITRTQQHPRDACDDGDEPGDGGHPGPLGFVAWHEGRW